MSDTQKHATDRPVFTRIEAQLYVADVQRSCEFYRDKLGFAVEFVYGEPPFYGHLNRDSARLNLRLVSEPVFAGNIREREGLLSATITVATSGEIEQLFLDFLSAAVPFQ